jgi:hypothetical protein
VTDDKRKPYGSHGRIATKDSCERYDARGATHCAEALLKALLKINDSALIDIRKSSLVGFIGVFRLHFILS